MSEVSSGLTAVHYTRLVSGVLLARVLGVVTVPGWRECHRRMLADGGPPVLAGALDFTASALAVSPRDLLGSLQALPRWAQEIPLAFVSTHDQEPQLLDYSSAAAGLGVNRQVFRDLAPALRWASRHAVRRQSTVSPGRQMAR